MKKDTFYFATDGSYGHADGLVLADTGRWTEKDWELIENASDDERVQVAREIVLNKE